MRRWLLAGLLATGCGRVGFDARAEDAPAPDAPFAIGAWSAPMPLAGLSSPQLDDDVSLTADMLEIFFMSGRAQSGTDSFYTARRNTIDEPFGAPTIVAEVQAGGPINNPKVTLDGLSMVFAAGRQPSAGDFDLWQGTRADRSSPWVVSRIDELATAIAEYEAYLAEDRLAIYFTSNSAGMGDIFVATRASPSQAFGAPVRVPELSSPMYDGGVFLTDHGRVALLHRYVGASISIVEASRASVADAFGTPQVIVEINGAGEEQDPWLSPDGRVLVFMSNMTGTYDFYIAMR